MKTPLQIAVEDMTKVIQRQQVEEKFDYMTLEELESYNDMLEQFQEDQGRDDE